MRIKFKLKVDDSLDVLAVHFVGGVVGMLFLGFFARELLADGGGALGVLNGGDWTQMGKQATAVVAAAAFAFVASVLIAWLVKAIMGLRVTEEEEFNGLDLARHGETAYEIHA